MPRKSPTPCTTCGRPVVSGGKCARHLADHRRRTDAKRGNFRQRGYDGDHQDFREAVLDRDRWICRLCGAAATVADHWPLSKRELVTRGLNPNDPNAGRALCVTCHNRHTGRTEGARNLPQNRR